MIVELIGMPGVGKTTVITQLRERLSEAGIAALYRHTGSKEDAEFVSRSRHERNFARVARLASTPLLAVAAAVRVRNKATAADLLRMVNREVKRRAVSDIPDGVVLIDEGPLHKLCMFHADGRIARPASLARWLVAPDLCVVLEAGVDTALDRIQARADPWKRVDRKPMGDLETYLTRYTDGVRLLEGRLRCPVVHVSTEAAGAPAELQTLLTARLRSGLSIERGRIDDD